MKQPELLPRFFITHSFKDADFARRLAADLHSCGLDGFFDIYSIKPGDDIASRIARGLEECDVYVPVLSLDALESPWCEREINTAINLSMERGRGGRPHIIPLVVRECTVPILLRPLLHINFAGDYDEALHELLEKGFGIDKQQIEQLAREKTEQERFAKEQAEAQRQAREKAEQERFAKEQAEAQQRAREKAEQERLAKERAEALERVRKRAEQERLAKKEQAEARQRAREKAEQEPLANEQAKAEWPVIGKEESRHISYSYEGVDTLSGTYPGRAEYVKAYAIRAGIIGGIVGVVTLLLSLIPILGLLFALFIWVVYLSTGVYAVMQGRNQGVAMTIQRGTIDGLTAGGIAGVIAHIVKFIVDIILDVVFSVGFSNGVSDATTGIVASLIGNCIGLVFGIIGAVVLGAIGGLIYAAIQQNQQKKTS